MLTAKESLEFLKDLPLAKWKIANSAEDLGNFIFPIYLKIDTSGHKTEVGGVLKCNNVEDLKKNLKILQKNFPKNQIIAQENFSGIEMIVGIKQDKVFGKVLVVGFGGIFAEIEKDILFRVLPISRKEVESAINELRNKELFHSRGKKYNLEKFITLVEKVAYLGEKFDIKEMDLNPVIVGEKDVKIVDARIEI